MRYIYPIFLLLFLACNTKTQKLQSINGNTPEKEASVQEDVETMSFDEIYQDFEKGYYQEKRLDTIFWINGEKYELMFNYHCLLDSSVVIPYKYYEGELNKDFITHNYIIDIQVSKDDKLIYKNKLLKNDFTECITENLKKYGVLLYPYYYKFDKIRQSFILGFSISIPLTDIGRGVYLAIDINGHAKCLSKL